MSMFNDVLGFGRSSISESMVSDTIEPEIAEMTLENAADIDEDPMDFMLRVAYENEMNMMNLDTAIIAEEYIYLRENGQEMVTEAGKIETIISKAKSMIMKLWEKIQSFFKSVLKKVDEALKLDQRFLDKYEKKAAGKTGKARGTEALFDVNGISTRGVAILDKIADLADTIKAAIDKDEAIENWNGVNIVANGKSGKDDGNKAVMKAIIKGYSGEKDSIGSFKADAAIKAFKESKGAKNTLKKAYDSNKKAINKQLKAAKTMETRAKKFKVIPTETSKSIHTGVKALNNCGTTLTLVNRTFVKAINMSRNFCKAVIIAAAAKSVESDSTNESASLVESFDIM